ncbi:hypothetical protein HNQ96_005365 [Aminobacter lissarensis]|uniref:Uncharacterized protein n=1 Tax=Aminobacter carboxidus TaxID=376165 RepID=A0A8E1WL83_9HYPH|nr:hypothetical protein [Aminobacter lissarensis]MBB6469475.1 hypothetical protein [Aminobacter lissarensis]
MTMLIPENLKLLHTGEEVAWQKSIATIEADPDLSLHLAMIECVMDLLQFYRMAYDEKDEDQLIVKLLGARIFNDLGASIRLILGGYYQAAGLPTRDILETGFLLDYFSTDPALIQKWKAVPEEKRNKEFNQAKIREVLDKRDGYEGKKRYEHYKLLSAIAAHPTFAGFTMLRPEPGADAHMGPFFVPNLLTATIQELVKVTMTAWENFKWFFKPETLPQFRATLRYLEMSSEWVERIYGKKLDRRDIEAVKRILAQIDGQPSDRVPPAA